MQMIFVYLLKKYEVESKQLLAGEKNTKDQNIIDIRINFEHRRMNGTKQLKGNVEGDLNVIRIN